MFSYYSRYLATVPLLLFIASSAQAKSSVCSPAYEAQIRASFYSGDSVSNAKVDAYIARLKQKKTEIAGLLAGKVEMKADANGKVAKADKIQKAIADSKSLTALDLAIAAAESMKTAKSFAQICDAATTASDLEGALRIEGMETPFTETLRTIRSVLETWSVPKISPATDEASNLVDASGNVLGVADLANAQSRGVDLSALQPARGSVFYTPISNIPSVDVRQAALGATMPIYKGLGNVFPAENVFIYDSVKKSNTRPKIDAYVEGDKNTKFKLKFQAEYNADPVVNAIMMTLGFPGDLSKYAAHIKLVLPKDVSIHDLKRDWESYFSRDRVNKGADRETIESLIESTSKDAQGRTVITFKEGSVEAHPEQLLRVGGWKYSDGDHNSRREVRGMTLVQMWLDDADLKEFDNNNILLRQNSDGSYMHVLYNADVGHALGSIYQESPSLYTWNMIKSTSGSTVDFTYRHIHPVSIKNKITMADARWAARLIAQMTRPQIAQAVALGGWPECVQKAFVEKMISRRNDLLQGLGLIGARQADGSVIALMPVSQDRKSFDIENVCKWDQGGKAETEKYGFNAGSVVDPLLISAKRQLLALARASIGGPKRLVLKSKDFHWGGPRPIAEALFNIDRTVERNPSPKNEQDLFIVKDTFALGIRAGVTVGPYADVVEKYSWELAYPARSKADAATNNGFIVNLLLPRNAREGKLPESYVLKTEHSFEVGAGLQFDNPGTPVSVAAQIGGGKVKAWRSVYDHRDGQRVVLYRDRQDYTQDELDLFLRLAVLKIPVLEAVKQWGNALGKGVVLSAADMNNPAISAAVDQAVTEGDFSGLASRETDFFSNDEFQHSLRKWNLLLWHKTSENRLDRIQIDTDKDRNVVQFKTSKGTKFGFLSTRTEKTIAVEVFADPASPQNLELQVSVMGTDVKTSDTEMANKYLRFINGLSVDGSPVIALTPALGYTTNGSWGDTLTESNTSYSALAMSRILKASPEAFWNALAASIKISRASLDALRSGADRTHAQDLVIDHAEDYLKQLAKAVAERTLEKKVSRLAEAVRKAVFLDHFGFYNPAILGALNRLAGADALYSRNLITVPDPKMINLPEGTPAFGRIGTPPKESLKYLVFAPVTAVDLYNMFDTWF